MLELATLRDIYRMHRQKMWQLAYGSVINELRKLPEFKPNEGRIWHFIHRETPWYHPDFPAFTGFVEVGWYKGYRVDLAFNARLTKLRLAVITRADYPDVVVTTKYGVQDLLCKLDKAYTKYLARVLTGT